MWIDVCQLQADALGTFALSAISLSPVHFRKQVSRRIHDRPGSCMTMLILHDYDEQSPLPTHIHHRGWMKRKLLFHQDTKMGGCWLLQINLAYPHWYFWKDQWLLTAQKKTLIPLLVFKVFYNLTWIYLSNVCYNHRSDSTICFFLEPNSSELHLEMSLLSITGLSIAA